MEKINVAELLKDCPKGMKLYSPIFGDVYLDKIRPHLAIVVTTDKEQGIFKEEFLYDGRYKMNGECMLFPSKGKTTWEGFQRPFRDGDVISAIVNKNLWYGIYQKESNAVLYCYVSYSDATESIYPSNSYGMCLIDDILEIRLATEEEKQKLFDAIKKNGYKWNPETKTLEKLIEPRFKVGDKVRLKSKPNYIYTIYCLTWDDNKKLAYKILPENDKHLTLISLDAQDNYELVPNKFDISTLKPFDKVLYRMHHNDTWLAGFYDVCIKNKIFIIGSKAVPYCIPYEGNQHLHNTTNDCDDFYKI